jgi:hypothetical protein
MIEFYSEILCLTALALISFCVHALNNARQVLIGIMVDIIDDIGGGDKKQKDGADV